MSSSPHQLAQGQPAPGGRDSGGVDFTAQLAADKAQAEIDAQAQMDYYRANPGVPAGASVPVGAVSGVHGRARPS